VAVKILQAGIFQDHELGGDLLFEKGFVQNGCEIERFDYRTVARQLGLEGMRREFVGRVGSKDLAFVSKGELFDRRTLREARQRGVTIILWYGDVRPEPEQWLLDLLGEVDSFFMSSGGDVLKAHFRLGKPGRAAYYLNPADPELVRRYAYLPRGTRNVVFTGTGYSFAGGERRRTVRYLQSRGDVALFGGAEYCGSARGFAMRVVGRLTGRRPGYLRGESYVAAIRSGRIGVGVSAVNNIYRYTSDRLSHYLAFGTFYLCWYFPGVEELFEPGSELVCFRSVDELHRLIEEYLQDVERREAVARAGQARMLRDYNCRDMTGMMLEVAGTGTSQRYPWVEVLEGV
jgi:hypothetical protein